MAQSETKRANSISRALSYRHTICVHTKAYDEYVPALPM